MIYIVYSYEGKNPFVYEFFTCKKDAELYIDTHEHKNYLDIYHFNKRTPKNSNFIKGWYREIVVWKNDSQLLNYFTSLLDYHSIFTRDKSMESTFIFNFLDVIIKEIESRSMKDNAC